MPISATYLAAIQKFEGFSERANWDYAQYTNGYGTKARSPTEMISKVEAESRFRSEITAARNLVDRFAPNLDGGTKAALTSLTFNAGTAWMKSGLGRAVQSGELNQVREIFVQYNKAGGEVLPGLVARRATELTWIGSAGDEPTNAVNNPLSSTGSGDQSWMQDVLDPVGFDAPRSSRQPSVSEPFQSYLGAMSAQFLAQLSLDVWDFLARADAGDGNDGHHSGKTDT